MDPVRLRPLGVAEVLDAAVKILQRSFRPMLATAAIVVVPLQALNTLVFLSAIPSPHDTTDTASATISGGLLVVGLVGAVAQILAAAACSKEGVDTYVGLPVRTGESLRFLGRRTGRLLWLLVIFVVVVTVGAFACFVPGVWLFVAWICAFPVLLVEGVGGRDALRRSFQLVRHRWWATFTTLLLAYVFHQILAQLLGLIVREAFGTITFANVDGYVLALMGASLATYLVMTPLYGAIVAVLYVDLRVRKEGFDLMLLAQHMHAPSQSLA